MNLNFSKSTLFGLILVFAGSALAANQCVDLFTAPEISISQRLSDQQEAIRKIAIQHFYQNAVDFLQKRVTVSSFRSTTAIEERNKLNLIHFLKSGKSDEAIDIYRDKFDAVELSYWMIKQYREFLEHPVGLTDLAKIKVRLQIFERRFAKHYGEYIGVRTFLENAALDSNPNRPFSEAAKKTLKSLSVHKFSEIYEDFVSLKIPEKRPSIADIKALYRSSSTFTRLKLWNDFKNEIVSVAKFIMSAEVIVGSIDSVFNKFPPNVAFRLKSFTGLMRSAKLRNRYLPLIVEIETLPEDIALRIEDLRRKNTTTPNDELLITYARTVDFTDSWNALKAEAKNRAGDENNLIAKKFYARILAAEQKALKLPDISLFEKVSNIDSLFTIVQTGILLKMTGPQVYQSLNEFFGFLATVPFLH